MSNHLTGGRADSVKDMNLIRTGLVTAVILTAGSCALLQNRLASSVPDIKPGELTFSDTTYESTAYKGVFQVQNMIAAEIILNSADYELVIDGRVTDFKEDLNIKIAGNEKKEIELQGTVNYLTLEPGQTYRIDLLGQVEVAFQQIPGVETSGTETAEKVIVASADLTVPGLPLMQISRVNLKSVDFLGADLEIAREVHNTNNFDLTVDSQAGKITTSDGLILGRESVSAPLSVKAGSKTEQVSTARVNFLAAGMSVIDLLKKGDLNLNISSIAQIKAGSNSYSLSDTATEALSLPALPEFSYRDFSVAEIRPDGIILRLDFIASNKADVAADLGRVVYKVSTGGNTPVSAASDEIKLAPGETKQVSLKQNISFLDMGMNLSELYTGRETGLNFTGSIENFLGSGEKGPSFSSEGVFKAPVMPSVSYGDFKYIRTDLSNPLKPAADFELSFRIANDNLFALALKKVDFNFTALSKKIITGSRQNVPLKADSVTVIRIPVKLQGSELFSMLSHFKSLSSGEYNLSGDFAFDVSGVELGRSFSLK